MATVHGTIGTFDPSLDANAITTEAKKRAVLLSSCGRTTYALIRSLASPTKPGDIAYADLLVLIGKHYSPAPESLRSTATSEITSTTCSGIGWSVA